MNVVGIVLSSYELQSKLKHEIQIVRWSEGDATMTAEQSDMEAVDSLEYTGSEQVKIDLPKIFFDSQSTYKGSRCVQKIALGGKHRSSHLLRSHKTLHALLYLMCKTMSMGLSCAQEQRLSNPAA